jgi:hypothetical protein
MKRITFYVDGFNFYFALKRIKAINTNWKRFYWIDIVKLFQQFVGPDSVLEKVIYFTATPLSSHKSSRQGTLFNANILINGEKFEVVRGKYFSKQIMCTACGANISKPEEKRTDVNISVKMIGDCIQDKTDVLVLVSADSDLVPPIEFIQENFREKKVKVYFPPLAFCYDINDNIVRNKGHVIKLEDNEKKFFNSIMPDVVSNTDGSKSYTIPQEWK